MLNRCTNGCSMGDLIGANKDYFKYVCRDVSCNSSPQLPHEMKAAV